MSPRKGGAPRLGRGVDDGIDGGVALAILEGGVVLARFDAGVKGGVVLAVLELVRREGRDAWRATLRRRRSPRRWGPREVPWRRGDHEVHGWRAHGNGVSHGVAWSASLAPRSTFIGGRWASTWHTWLLTMAFTCSMWVASCSCARSASSARSLELGLHARQVPRELQALGIHVRHVVGEHAIDVLHVVRELGVGLANGLQRTGNGLEERRKKPGMVAIARMPIQACGGCARVPVLSHERGACLSVPVCEAGVLELGLGREVGVHVHVLGRGGGVRVPIQGRGVGVCVPVLGHGIGGAGVVLKQGAPRASLLLLQVSLRDAGDGVGLVESKVPRRVGPEALNAFKYCRRF